MSMNGFQVAGDVFLYLAMLLLFLKIGMERSCSGISCVAQVLYLVTFITRYIDLPLAYYIPQTYSTAAKCYRTFGTTLLVIIMCTVSRRTYDYKHDSKWMFLLLLPPAILAQFVHDGYTQIKVWYAFSRYLEVLAMLPQFVMICRMGQVEVTVLCYLVMMACYRLLYMCNWAFRYFAVYWEEVDQVTWIPGFVQFLLYAAFFFLCLKAKKCPPSEAESDVVEKEPVPTSATETTASHRGRSIELRGLTKYYEKLTLAMLRFAMIIKRAWLAEERHTDDSPNSEEIIEEKQPITSVDLERAAGREEHPVDTPASSAV